MSRPLTEKRRCSIIQRNRLGDVQADKTTHSLLPNLLEAEEEYRACAENGLCELHRGVPEWKHHIGSRDSTTSQHSRTDSGKWKHLDNNGLCSSTITCILLELKKITTKLRQDEEESELKNEWRFAALVIDRLCLWICLAATLISTAAILCSAPHLVA